MRNTAALVGIAAILAAGAARAAPSAGWTWTTSQAVSSVTANGHPGLTASCRGLGKPYRGLGVARYSRFRCVVDFPDGSEYALVIEAKGQSTYHLVSSHKVHGAGKQARDRPPKHHH